MKKVLIFISIFTIIHSLALNYFLSGDCYDYFTKTIKFFIIQDKKVLQSDSGEEYRFICKKCDDGVLYSFPAYLEEYNSFSVGNNIGVEIKGSDLCKDKKYEDLRAYYFLTIIFIVLTLIFASIFFLTDEDYYGASKQDIINWYKKDKTISNCIIVFGVINIILFIIVSIIVVG